MGLQGLAQENEEYRKELEYFKNKSSRQMKEIERLKVIEKRYNQIKELLEDKNIDSNLELAIKINQVVHKGM